MTLIRDYRTGDLDVLWDIDQVCFEPGVAYTRVELRFHVSDPRSVTLVAESGDGVSGFAVGRVEDAAAGHVITVDVLPQARHRGVGTALMTALHAELVSRKARISYLEVDQANAAAIRFYHQLGYARAGPLPDYYGTGRDAVKMVRLLREEGETAEP